MIVCKDQCLLVTYQKKQRKLIYGNIISIYHQKGFTVFKMKEGRDYRIPLPFKAFYSALLSEGFEKTSRCEMINLQYMKMLDISSKKVYLTTGDAVPVSRRCLKKIQESWEES